MSKSSHPFGSVYNYIRAVYETCFRDRGIDRLCVKCVSEIGALIEACPFCFPFLPSAGNLLSWFLLISLSDCGLFLYPQLFTLPLISYLYTMSSPASSYIQIGLDNLERPLNRSPSPRAQVRGLIGLLVAVD